ncbi:hypothetical protein L596_000597 [Steinernema carpocapsae]|uniref:HD/PDEase domain-containing protein n=1 Tax=Steinernema carpocapsae TaxID=34508 RepID=A0A4U8UJ97_STECR|nr:hypothetical protein L596_000597 [Steinernema carpocapsae]
MKIGFVKKGRNQPVTKRFQKFPSNSYRHITDPLHSNLYLYHPVDLIVDTPEFQRLRRLKQTSLSSLLYPNSDHSRFTHSLGTYCLALEFVEKLSGQKKLKITSRDKLCVALAGLCHDLGHGPFSHTFEAVIDPTAGWKHEVASTQIFRRIMERENVRASFESFLDLDEDIDFICELINPPKEFIQNGQWMLKGRSKEKAYLYGFVSNVHDSFDVDKFDYLLRDSKASSPSALSIASITIKDSVRVGFDHCLGHNRLVYSVKVKDVLASVATARLMLHNNHYQHKTCLGCEQMLCQALALADPFFEFLGDDGRSYSLKTAHEDLGAFLKLDDSVYSMIRCMKPSHPDIIKAQKILDDLESRRIPPLIVEIDGLSNQDAEEFKAYLREAIAGKVGPNESDEFFVFVKSLHCGMGLKTHPLSRVLVYNHKTVNELDALDVEDVDESWKRLWLTLPSGGVKKFLVYAHFYASDALKEALYEASLSYAQLNKVPTPLRRNSPRHNAKQNGSLSGV